MARSTKSKKHTTNTAVADPENPLLNQQELPPASANSADDNRSDAGENQTSPATTPEPAAPTQANGNGNVAPPTKKILDGAALIGSA